MKNIIYIFLSVVFIPSAWSQNITDIIRWSDFSNTGTAGSLGVSNSIGAVGGDITAAGINPAGIAEFKKFVFNFSAGMNSVNNASYLKADPGSVNNTKSNQFGIYNAGLVFGNYRPKKNFTSSNFAIGFTRQNTFKEKIFYKGQTVGTITEYFAEKANGRTIQQLDDFAAYPAYITGAIFDFDEDRFYETDFAQDNLSVIKEQNITRSGNVNELSLTWAGEYKDKFNIGIGIGIPFANFSEQKVYIEQDPEDEIATFNYLKYIEDLTITGRGFNTKIGIIAKPFNWLRIGGAFHSPTWFRFSDVYTTTLDYAYDDQYNTYPGPNDERPELNFEYRITNPWRAVGSVGSVFALGDIKGFVNADIEFIDYASAEYDGTAFSSDPGEIEYTNTLNQTITNTLTSSTNVRLGAELAYDAFRLRGGWYQFYSPFANQRTANNSYSMGLGFRGESFFVDFALQFSNTISGYNAYTVTNALRDPLVNIDRQNTLGLVTLGFRL